MWGRLLNQLSATDALAEWLRPLAFALAALASAWVLRDAMRSRLSAPATASWALITLMLPQIAAPAYLAARIFTRKPRPAARNTVEPSDEKAASGDDVTAALSPSHTTTRALPALYLLALLTLGALYFYADNRSPDARLMRATEAKLRGRTDEAAREYRAALATREDSHTRKLLGLLLADAGRWDEALTEFRAAASRSADDDGRLPLHSARALDALGQRGEADAQYRTFLNGAACAPSSPDPECDAVRERLRLAAAQAP